MEVDFNATAEFEKLRAEYFSILNTSLLVAFELTNRDQALETFKVFKKKFQEFSSKHYANKYTREMSRAVANLESFYAKH